MHSAGFRGLLAIATTLAGASVSFGAEVLPAPTLHPDGKLVLPRPKRKSYWSPKKRTNSTTRHKRNGTRECARRVRQMAAGTHGYAKVAA